jgi:hypothetical protein
VSLARAKHRPREFAAKPKLKDGERMDPQWHQYYRLIPVVRSDLCRVMLGETQFPDRLHRAAKN